MHSQKRFLIIKQVVQQIILLLPSYSDIIKISEKLPFYDGKYRYRLNKLPYIYFKEKL
jgi:hypothetical protein